MVEDRRVDVRRIPLWPTVIRATEFSMMGSSRGAEQPAEVNDSLIIIHQQTIPL